MVLALVNYLFKNRMTKLLETHHMMVTLLSSF